MKILICCLLFIGAGVLANEREKRQTGYSFPGPRIDRSGGAYDRPAAAGYSAQQNSASYVDDQEDTELYQVPRRQFQAQPVQQQYAPAQSRAVAPAPAPAPAAYEPAPRAPAPAPRQTYTAPAPAPRKKASASTNRANKYGAAPQQALNGADEEEEEQLPDALTLLLQDSKFNCGSKNDGYYADDSVNCQVFHYCVGGARHSWMCPEGTVFHQVHLNCVPDSQDICAQSPKFHFVNDYLYKPIDYQGPNNTARYAQRYYPDGYVVGDPIVAPQGQGQAQARPQQQPTYNPQPPAPAYHAPAPAPAPVARPPPRQVAPPAPQPPSYNQAAPAPASYGPASSPARAPRPSRPARPVYQQEAPQSYRASPASQAPAPPPSQQVSYQPQDNQYQPAPQTRRQPSSSQSQSYSHSRQQQPQQPQQQQQPQYRPSSNRASPQQYQSYGSNQAAGVQYDEDY